MYKKVENTTFGVGYINDEFLLAPPGEFDFENNQMTGTETVSTYVDDVAGLTLYGYKDKLVTFKELRREYLIDYYKV